MPTEERRTDTVAVSRPTVKAVTWVSTVVILAISGFIWDLGDQVDDLVTDHKVLLLKVSHLEEFGPGRGERFTQGDGKELKGDFDELKRWLLEMQKSINQHHALGEHPFAGRRLNSLEGWKEGHEEKHDGRTWSPTIAPD